MASSSGVADCLDHHDGEMPMMQAEASFMPQATA
jgi:hypothetical protein